jgi:23S rRNA pseudouridine2457 synthase
MPEQQHRYFILNKPYNMLSQFISPYNMRLLGEIDFPFPEGTHAIGRLDNHSEGLLILTTNKKITRLLFHPEKKHKRTYMVRVQHQVTENTLQQLRNGVSFQTTGDTFHNAVPYSVDIVEDPGFSFDTPYFIHTYIEYTWLKIILTEGKYHQIRKMTAAVKHRCVRLVRTGIEDLTLGELQPGGVQEIGEEDFFRALKLGNGSG